MTDLSKIIGKLAFPEYKGRKFYTDMTGFVRFCDLNWSGGSRNTYTCIRLADGQTAKGDRSCPPWSNPFEGARVEIPMGFAIVEHTMSCGKDLGLTVYLNPQQTVR